MRVLITGLFQIPASKSFAIFLLRIPLKTLLESQMDGMKLRVFPSFWCRAFFKVTVW
jgi:hypothetical protein